MFIKTSGAKAQLAAKDEIIRTNEQSIESLEKRLTTLESEFAKAGIKIAQLGDDLLVSKTENEHLRKYNRFDLGERERHDCISIAATRATCLQCP